MTLPFKELGNDEPPSGDDVAELPRRIQSLEVGFRLLRIVEEAAAALTLKEISSRANMPRSKAHLYLSTFLGLGVISRDSSGRYLLGPYSLQLGLSALRQSSVIDVSEAAMHALQVATGHSVHLSIWGNHGPTIVKKLDGNLQLPVSVRVGFVMPLLSSATGRVFLAYEPESLTMPLVEKEKSRTGLDSNAVATLVKGVRAAGFASSDGGLYEGFAALSAPIFDHANQLCAAIAVLDSAARMPADKRIETAARLKQASDEISTRLGRG